MVLLLLVRIAANDAVLFNILVLLVLLFWQITTLLLHALLLPFLGLLL